MGGESVHRPCLRTTMLFSVQLWVCFSIWISCIFLADIRRTRCEAMNFRLTLSIVVRRLYEKEIMPLSTHTIQTTATASTAPKAINETFASSKTSVSTLFSIRIKTSCRLSDSFRLHPPPPPTPQNNTKHVRPLHMHDPTKSLGSN